MNAERLLELYDRVAEAPDAVARLRRFVLDLAVRGKLVEQDLGDEPASELLKRMAAQKARMMDAGEIRASKQETPIRPEEVPFVMPSNWSWVRLRGIGRLSGGMTPSKSCADYWDGELVWLSPKDIKSDEVSDSELKITGKGRADTRLELFPPGSLFIVARSGILKRSFPVAINRVWAASNQDLKVLVPFIGGQERYLQIMFRGLRDFLLKKLVKTGTTVQSLKYREFEAQPFPVPPLAEQHRIVEKVDELMALCDRLEEARTTRETTRNRLTTASLARLTAPDTDEQTFRSHARFALDAFPALTTRPDQIKALRQTILNLAVRGKLVEQDPADEPASELLRRIADEKEEQSRGSSRSGSHFLRPENGSSMASIPRTWKWAALNDLALRLHYGYTASADFNVSDVRFLRITDIQSNFVDWQKVPGCTIDKSSISKYKLKKGDILIARTGGTIGKTFLVCDMAVTAIFASYLIRVRPAASMFARYMKMFLESDLYWSQLQRGARGGGQPNVNGQTLGRMSVPIPPVAEQHRIVERVEELSGLCDRLECALDAGDATRQRLLESVLIAALEPAGSELEVAECL